MDRPIEARVAAVVDDSTLVLNVGFRQGVVEGMAFVVFDEHADVTDPVTHASLGRLECVKAKVQVTHVQASMCTVRAPVVSEREVTDGTRPLSAVMVEHSLGKYGPTPPQWQRLPVRAGEVTGRSRVQPIAVGDGARSVPGGAGSMPPAGGGLAGGPARESGDAAAP